MAERPCSSLYCGKVAVRAGLCETHFADLQDYVIHLNPFCRPGPRPLTTGQRIREGLEEQGNSERGLRFRGGGR